MKEKRNSPPARQGKGGLRFVRYAGLSAYYKRLFGPGGKK